MQTTYDALLYKLKTYNIEIEIDFYIHNVELTWHITVYFFDKQNNLIKSIYFNKKQMRLSNAIREVYWETNTDVLLRTRIEEFKIPNHFLEDDTYKDVIYPMVSRLKTLRKDTMTNLEKRIVFQNTTYL